MKLFLDVMICSLHYEWKNKMFMELLLFGSYISKGGYKHRLGRSINKQ